jgi:hypothetical protein
MHILVKSNNPIRLGFLQALLRDAGIECWVLDEFASSVEGSIGAIPRRLVVADEDIAQARRILADSGLA